jgi:hypothetical protein
MSLTLAIVGFIVSFLSGGAAGSVITIIVTGRRDYANRRSRFIAFVRQWRSEVEQFDPGTYNELKFVT